MKTNEILDLPIHIFLIAKADSSGRIPTRLYNRLKRGGYKTVGDVAKATYSELMNIRDLGAKSVDTLCEFLLSDGIEIDGYEDANSKRRRMHDNRLLDIQTYIEEQISDHNNIDFDEYWKFIRRGIYLKYGISKHQELATIGVDNSEVTRFAKELVDNTLPLFV